MVDYVLHYAPDNASLIVRLVLEELGLPYETRLVDRSRAEQRSDAYRRINPAGLIPALEGPDGTVFETAAICLYLADRAGQLAPGPLDAGRGAFLKYLFFTSNSLHTGLRMTFYPAQYAGADAGAQAVLLDTMRDRLTAHFALLEAAARDGEGGLCGDAPSVTAFYVATCIRWAGLYPSGQTGWFRLAHYPALRAMAQALEARPSVLAAQEAEGLGPHPFTAPCPCNPPEGVAL